MLREISNDQVKVCWLTPKIAAILPCITRVLVDSIPAHRVRARLDWSKSILYPYIAKLPSNVTRRFLSALDTIITSILFVITVDVIIVAVWLSCRCLTYSFICIKAHLYIVMPYTSTRNDWHTPYQIKKYCDKSHLAVRQTHSFLGSGFDHWIYWINEINFFYIPPSALSIYIYGNVFCHNFSFYWKSFDVR